MPSRIEDIAQQIRFAIGSHNREDSGETGAFPVRAPAETAIAAVVSDKKELTKEVIAEIALLPLADSLKALDKASPGMGFTTAILVALDEQHAFAGRKNLQALANRSYLSPGFVIGKLLTSDIPISIQDAFLAAGSYFVGEARRVAANFPLIEKDRATDNAQLRGVSAAREAFFPVESLLSAIEQVCRSERVWKTMGFTTPIGNILSYVIPDFFEKVPPESWKYSESDPTLAAEIFTFPFLRLHTAISQVDTLGASDMKAALIECYCKVAPSQLGTQYGQIAIAEYPHNTPAEFRTAAEFLYFMTHPTFVRGEHYEPQVQDFKILTFKAALVLCARGDKLKIIDPFNNFSGDSKKLNDVLAAILGSDVPGFRERASRTAAEVIHEYPGAEESFHHLPVFSNPACLDRDLIRTETERLDSEFQPG